MKRVIQWRQRPKFWTRHTPTSDKVWTAWEVVGRTRAPVRLKELRQGLGWVESGKQRVRLFEFRIAPEKSS